MSDPEAELVMIDATDALAWVVVRPATEGGLQGVNIEADAPGLDRQAAAEVFQRLAAEWAGRPIPFSWSDVKCPTCGSLARHLHPAPPRRPGARAYAELSTGESTACGHPWHGPGVAVLTTPGARRAPGPRPPWQVLAEQPAVGVDVPSAIAQACGDPGSIVARNPDESLARWSSRAVLHTLTQLGVVLPRHSRVD